MTPHPQDAHVLIPRIFDCVTLYGKRDFVGMIKLRPWRWGDYPGSVSLF